MACQLTLGIRVPDVVERGESLMSNLALGAGSNLDRLHDALGTEGGVYIWILPLGRSYLKG